MIFSFLVAESLFGQEKTHLGWEAGRVGSEQDEPVGRHLYGQDHHQLRDSLLLMRERV